MKLPNRLLLATLAAAIALPAISLAAKGDRKKKGDTPETTFATIDKNSDGVVTEKEYLELMEKPLGATAAKARFAKLDKDSDGKLTKEEYASGGTEKKKRERKKKKDAN